MSDKIVGAVSSEKMKPSETLKDMMIFELPIETAKSFVVESDPGFWRSISEDRVQQLSDTSFKLRFSKDEIRESQ